MLASLAHVSSLAPFLSDAYICICIYLCMAVCRPVLMPVWLCVSSFTICLLPVCMHGHMCLQHDLQVQSRQLPSQSCSPCRYQRLPYPKLLWQHRHSQRLLHSCSQCQQPLVHAEMQQQRLWRCRAGLQHSAVQHLRRAPGPDVVQPVQHHPQQAE